MKCEEFQRFFRDRPVCRHVPQLNGTKAKVTHCGYQRLPLAVLGNSKDSTEALRSQSPRHSNRVVPNVTLSACDDVIGAIRHSTKIVIVSYFCRAVHFCDLLPSYQQRKYDVVTLLVFCVLKRCQY
jgi:hypothetical protein